MRDEIKVVKGAILGAKTIGLMTHVRGDGDALGSLLGLRNIIKQLGKKSIIISNESLPDYMQYLKKEAKYYSAKIMPNLDLLIVLDIASKKRMTVPAAFKKAARKGTKTIVIDHHSDGDLYAESDIVWQKTDTSSTAEMVYWLAKELQIKIDRQTAQYLLWGIDTDTYFLSNPNVYPSTKEARQELLAAGASEEEIRERLKSTSPTANPEFLRTITDRSYRDPGDKLLGAYITSKDLKKFGYKPGSSSTIANYLNYQNDSKIVLVAEQRTPNMIKVSMRSNKSGADVSSLCSFFGGGGHVKAAGFEIYGKLEEILRN